MHEASPTCQGANSQEPGWLLLSVVSRWRRSGFPPRGESNAAPNLLPRSPTLHRQISLQRNFCVLCRSSAVPPRTPAMSYFTPTAPQGPRCHALVSLPSWGPRSWWRPSRQQAVKHPAVERRPGLECHRSSHGHRRLSLLPSQEGTMTVMAGRERSHASHANICVNTRRWR